jgi:molybdenum cofactor synthesis domain-containing protein
VISVAGARRLILSGVAVLAPRRLPLSGVSGHVLAEAVRAAENVPRFANSAMDGYALRAADTVRAPVRLRVIGTTAAGDDPAAPLAPGEAMRVMTGAPLPAGADAVCMIEHARADDCGSAVVIGETVTLGTNVRQPGEDIAAGAAVFGPGTQLGPAHAGVLASLGIRTLLVHPRPTVGVLSTGDELAGPDAPLAAGKIRDANRPALLARLGADGFRGVDLGMAGDDELVLADLLEAAASRCDAIIASGGVSVGDHDVLKVALQKVGGATMHSLRVAVKPGQHIAVARLGDRQVPAFGLPGNPVAALVSYEMFVRPALRAMAGCQVLDRPRLCAIAETDLSRRPGPKLVVLRVTARTGPGGTLRVRLSGGQDSHMLLAMAQANALALLPDGNGVRAGGPVEVLLLDGDVPDQEQQDADGNGRS